MMTATLVAFIVVAHMPFGMALRDDAHAMIASATSGCPVTKESFQALQAGPRGGALVPALVPPEGHTFQFLNKGGKGIQVGMQYNWELYAVRDKAKAGERGWKFNQEILTMTGTVKSHHFGHKTLEVRNSAGDEVFTIRMQQSMLNPWGTWSWRIFAPGSTSDENILFTVNRDEHDDVDQLYERWRIYRGRKRDNVMIFYCKGLLSGYDMKFYKTDKWDDTNVFATIAPHDLPDNTNIPDTFKLEVEPGADAALVLAVSSIVDMTHLAAGEKT